MFTQHFREGMVRAQPDVEAVLQETLAGIRMNLVNKIWEEGRKEAANPPDLQEEEIVYLLRKGIKMDGDRFFMVAGEVDKKGKVDEEEDKKEDIFLYNDEIKIDTEGNVVLQTLTQGRRTVWKKVNTIPFVTRHGVNSKETDRLREATQKRVRNTTWILRKVGYPEIGYLALEEKLRNIYEGDERGPWLKPIYGVRTMYQQLRVAEAKEYEGSHEFWRLRHEETDKQVIEKLVQKVLREEDFTDMQNAHRVNTMAEHIAYSDKIDMKPSERLAMIVQMYEWLMHDSWNAYHRALEVNTTRAMIQLTHIAEFPTVPRKKNKIPGDALRFFGDEQANSNREGEYALATVRSVKLLTQKKEMSERDAIEQLWLLIRGEPREQMRLELGMKTSHSESIRDYKYNEIVDAFLNEYIKYDVAEAHRIIIKSRRDKETFWEDYVLFLRGMANYALLLDDEKRDREKLIKMTIWLQLTLEQRKRVRQAERRTGTERYAEKQAWEMAKILDKEESEMSPFGTVMVAAEDNISIGPGVYQPITAKVQTYQKKWVGSQRALSNQIVRGRSVVRPRWSNHVIFYPNGNHEDTTVKVTVAPDWTVPMTIYNGTTNPINIKRGQVMAHVTVEPQEPGKGTFVSMDVWDQNQKERDDQYREAERQQEQQRYKLFRARLEKRKAICKTTLQGVVVQAMGLQPGVIKLAVREKAEGKDTDKQSGGPSSPEAHQIGFLDNTEEEGEEDSETSWDVVDTEYPEGSERQKRQKRRKHGKAKKDTGVEKEILTGAERASSNFILQQCRDCERYGKEFCQAAHDKKYGKEVSQATHDKEKKTGTEKRRRDCEKCGIEFCQQAHDEGWKTHKKPCEPKVDQEQRNLKEEEYPEYPRSGLLRPINWAEDR